MKLIVIDTSYTLEDVYKKKLYQAIYSRDLGGFFHKVWSVHPFASLVTGSKWSKKYGKYKKYKLNKKHIFIEAKVGRYNFLKFIPILNFIFSQIELFFFLKRLIFKENIDCIKSSDPLYNSLFAYLLSKTTNKPFLVRVSGNFDKIYKDTKKPIMKKLFLFRFIEKIIERFIFKNADFVIAPNKDNLNYAFKNGLQKIKGKVVRYGSLISKDHLIKPSLRRKSNFFKKELNINSKNKILIYVGRLEKVKRVLDLVTIYQKLKNKSVKLLIVGTGSLKNQIKKKIIKNKLQNNILLLGEKNQHWLSKCLPNCSCFIATHTGRALAEASFAGLPVAGYNIDWHSEIIENNKNGFLVRPGEKTKLAKSILKIINNKILSKKFSRNIRYKAEKLLSPVKIEKIEIECFKKILTSNYGKG
jgi:glycosyltransferase involved in cell wall biosynthesis|tara:strand:- start:422 stop:1666 length:1245 start_codon:yes stop_codon:yes gene_type:complete